MKVERVRDNAFRLTMTGQELSAVIASTRLTRDAMAVDAAAPNELISILDQLLRDYERATAHLPQQQET